MIKMHFCKLNKIGKLCIVGLLILCLLLPIAPVSAATAGYLDIAEGSDEGAAAYFMSALDVGNNISMSIRTIEDDAEAKQLKEELGDGYETQILTWEYDLLKDGEAVENSTFVASAWILAIQLSLPIEINKDLSVGSYDSGYFEGTFDGYATPWDDRYTEAWLLKDDGTRVNLTNKGDGGDITGLTGSELNPALSVTLEGTESTHGKIVLVQKSYLPEEDEPLAPGTYHVPVDLWNGTMNRLSMANDAINHDAVVTVDKEGNATVQMEFSSMQIDLLTGHLLSLSYISEEDYRTYLQDTVENSALLKPVEVLEYKYMDDGTRYLGTVQFELSGHWNQKHYFRVKVDAMGDSQPFTTIKFHWNYAVRVDGNFENLPDGDYDVSIRSVDGLSADDSDVLKGDNFSDSIWGQGYAPADSETEGADGTELFGDTARAVIKDGKVTALYLQVNENLTGGNRMALSSKVTSESDAEEYNYAIRYTSAGQLYTGNSQNDVSGYAEIVSSENDIITLSDHKEREYNYATLIKLIDPKTTTGITTIRYAKVSSLYLFTSTTNTSINISLAWNQIPDYPMTPVTGRAELGELLTLAGEEADTTYAEQKAVYDDPVATQEELTAALDVMEKALAGQKAAKLEELKSAIQEAQNLNSDSYTETSFAALTEAVETASAAAENPESTLAEILQQISALDAARKALIADMDWSALDAQIEAAESIKKSQYTTASYQYMYNTLVEAREMRALLDTNPPSQEEIDELADELEARIASLVPLSSGSGGTTVTFEPASGEEFGELQDAVSAAKEKLGDSADGNVILQAAETALEDREISSDGVKALILVLGSLEPSSGETVTADRTALDALMTVAEEIVEKNDGTYQSVEGLSEAIGTARTYLDFADGDPAADTIEMASSVLREAFASLVRLEPEDEAIDVDKLAAGEYTVPISIKNAATPSQDSMANDAVEPNALITVGEDGTATMQLTFKPKYLESFDQWGHLLRAWLYRGETPEIAAENAYEVRNSVLMDLSGYYTVSEENPGEKIPMDSDPESPDDSSQYPGTVTFDMPYVSTQDGYETIYIRVSVDAMGGDSGAQNALLKIDYSQIQKLDDEGNIVESGVNRTGVTEAIAEAEKILEDADRYTAASLNDLRVALTAAYAVRYQEDAKQTALDEAAETLQAAVDSLSRDIGYVGPGGDYLTDTLNAGIFMEAPSCALSADTGLSAAVAAVNYDTIANKLGDDVVDFIPYSVSVIDENGSSVQADGTVTVKIYVPEGWDTDKLTVYSLSNLYTSRPQEISGGAMDKDGFFVFETASFGYFALAEMQESTGSGYQTGTVTFSAGEGGTLTAMVDGVEISSGDKVVYGEEVVFTATPETGYSIDSWSGISGSGNPVSRVVDGDLNVSVSFVADATGEEEDGTVTFSVSGTGGTLTASVDGEEIESGASVEGGKTVTFTAAADSGYTVNTWSGDVSGSSGTVTARVDGDMNVSVSFRAQSTGGNTGGSGSGSGGSGGSGGGSTPSDEFFLEDGYYYVDVDLWKTAANEASMGNVAFSNNDRALIRVQNGKVTTVQIATNPVDVDQYHSAIIEFNIPDASDVQILETGKVTTEPSGNEYDYIQRIQFTMPDAGQLESEDSVTYIDVQFKVPDTPMDAAVGETLDARLKFTWSTAEATDDTSLEQDSSTGSGTSSITGETITDVTLTDSSTGIRLETNTERLSDAAQMTVTRLTEGDAYDTAVSAMEDIDGEWTLYQIQTSVNGTVTAPEGSVTLSFPCGEEELTIYRISDSGQRTVLRGEVKNGYYVINTSSLGLFIVMGDVSDEIPPAETEEGSFTDMQDHWAKEYVDFVVERGLFNGVSDTEFSPNTSMTRGMFVTAVGRLAGVGAEGEDSESEDAGSGTTDFTDVSADSWYAPYVAWAAENGIVSGTTDTTFEPDRAITRQEMATLLSRYAEFAKIELTEGDTVTFTDSDEISDYAKAAVEAMASAGLIQGMGDGTFAPRQTATRAEVATLLARFMQEYSL